LHVHVYLRCGVIFAAYRFRAVQPTISGNCPGSGHPPHGDKSPHLGHRLVTHAYHRFFFLGGTFGTSDHYTRGNAFKGFMKDRMPSLMQRLLQ